MTAILLLSSCSTKKNSWNRRVYHNLTAHYNGWWNGDQSLKEGVQALEKKVNDNYTKILPVFNVGEKEEASAINANADRATEKGSIVIQMHSMYFGKKEYCKWIDDSYLMIGKSYFYKQEYQSAKRTFEFILSRYDDKDMLIEARIWLVRTLDRLEKFGQAANELDLLRSDVEKGELDRKQVEYYRQVYANHFILKGEPEFATPFLNESVIFAKRKMRKRCEFILGQIYRKEGNLEKASAFFEKAAKGAPTYKLEFNSRINLAMCYQGDEDGSASIMRQLEKMLDDEKNEDFQDQIYYAMSRLSFTDNNKQEAIKYLRLSVATSVENNYQKALSSLELAEIFFVQPNYNLAQAYYDTTMQVLPKDFPNYKALEKKRVVLSDLVDNLIVISEEDSLQRLAGMSDEERNAIIDKIIEEIIAEEIAQREREIRMMEEAQRGGTGIPNSAVGAWYFYNPQTITQGRKEFLGKWGKRKLEDLWFLSNKQITSFNSWESEEDLAEENGDVSDTTSISTDPKKRATYLQKLPFTEEQKMISNKKIAEALYNVGFIYKEGLNDTIESLNSFVDLVTRFPDTTINKKAMMTYYTLYKTNGEIGNSVEEQKYKELIIAMFPDSDFAKVLINPSYFKQLQEKANAASTLYSTTYKALMDNQFYVVIMNNETARNDFPTDTLLPYFELLNALAVGKLETKEKMADLLVAIINTHSESLVVPVAQEILGELANTNPAISKNYGKKEENLEPTAEEVEAKAIEQWTYKPETKQYCIIVIKANSREVRALQIRLSDFNKKNNRFDNLTINSMLFGTDRQMITVGLFNNATDGVNYYNDIRNDSYIMGMLDKKTHYMMVMSEDEYREFYKKKNLNDYMLFFKKLYLNKE